MRLITRLLAHIGANVLALITAQKLIPNVSFPYDFWVLAKIAVILGLINFFLKPIIRILTLPLIWLTLGLFTIVINIFLLWLTIYFAPELQIQGLAAFIWTMTIISIFNFIISSIIKEKKSLDPQS